MQCITRVKLTRRLDRMNNMHAMLPMIKIVKFGLLGNNLIPHDGINLFLYGLAMFIPHYMIGVPKDPSWSY
jgi:hypothetical protein